MSRFADIHSELSIVHRMDIRREEYLDHMTFRANRRPLFTEIFGPLVGVKDEWRAQGATEAECNLSAFSFRAPLRASVAASTGWIGGDQETIIEETEQHIIARDHMGRRVMLCKGRASLPLPLDYPVKTMDDWLRIREHYTFSESRFSKGWEDAARRHLADGKVVCVGIPGGFDQPRQLMGEENLCLAFYEQPDLIHAILTTIGDTACRVLDRVSSTVTVDQLCVHEDMAGKSGSLIGPSQITEFIKPYYRRVWNMLHERGARLFEQDSDGNMNSVVEAFLDAGINVMSPNEPAAGMDIVDLRRQYGDRLAFMGGIDKHVLRRSLDEIDRELEYKLPPMIRSGGCLLGLDHRIPNGTPIAHYRHYIKKVWELFEREAS